MTHFFSSCGFSEGFKKGNGFIAEDETGLPNCLRSHDADLPGQRAIGLPAAPSRDVRFPLRTEQKRTSVILPREGGKTRLQNCNGVLRLTRWLKSLHTVFRAKAYPAKSCFLEALRMPPLLHVRPPSKVDLRLNCGLIN